MFAARARHLIAEPGSSGERQPAGIATREQLVANLRDRGSWLELDAQIAKRTRSDHLIDALICAILARALFAQPALTEPIPPELQLSAAEEGWIHLPLRDALEQFG